MKSTQEITLLQAVKEGHVKGLKQLIKSGGIITLNSRDTGTTPLIEACKFGDKDVAKRMIKVLLKNGADVNYRDREGRNALHWVSIKGDRQLINLLAESDAPVDYQTTDKHGNSILFYAVETGNCSFVRHICKLYKLKSVKERGKNRSGISAADLALKLGHKKCAEMCQEVMLGDYRQLDPLSSNSNATYINDLNELVVLPPISSNPVKDAYKPGHVVPKLRKKAREGNDASFGHVEFHPNIRTESAQSDELIGVIDYKFVLTDLNWIQAVEHTSSYRPGVDERARLETQRHDSKNAVDVNNNGYHATRRNQLSKVKRTMPEKARWKNGEFVHGKTKKGAKRRDNIRK